MADLGVLPRWDMTPIFPSLESAEFEAAYLQSKQDVLDLGALFEARGVRRRESATVSAEDVAAFEEVTNRLNTLLQQGWTVRAYVRSFIATDAAHDKAQALLSELRTAWIALSQYQTRYTAWVGTMDVDALLAGSPVARAHEHLVRNSAILARHQMSSALEDLCAETEPIGHNGWARLHSDVTSLLTVAVPLPGGTQTLPMSAVRALANHPDRATRKAAYEAELRAWETVAVPLSAALNGVKGFQSLMHRRRGYTSDVEPTLLDNAIDPETLAAMQAACMEAFPDFRRYLAAKARALGVSRLAWYDLNAPVGEGNRVYTWPQAEDFILTQFGAYSDKMSQFAGRCFREHWIDAPPVPGKEGGAFCTDIRPGESRILMNYDGSFNSVSTLAHELGHAYHNLTLKDCTPLQALLPSTLAETASIFCETLAFDAALRETTGAERLGLLDVSLQHDFQVVVDIHSRFLFEQSVFARRSARELSSREFCELMLEAQSQTYGDGLDPDARHPYMWAVKGHYYGPTYYNYPYTFGLLFGLGLYARYRENPTGFHEGYDDLLASTGLADAATLASRFGIDTRSVAFWRSSLDVIRESIREFESLVPDQH